MMGCGGGAAHIRTKCSNLFRKSSNFHILLKSSLQVVQIWETYSLHWTEVRKFAQKFEFLLGYPEEYRFLVEVFT